MLGLGLAVVMAWGLTSTLAQGAEAAGSGCVLVEKEGKVEVARKGTTAFKAVAVGAALQNGDQLQTGSRSRATLRWSELSVLRVDELTSMEIQPPAKPGGKAQLDLKSGASYFFSREKPEDIQIRTPVASGAIRGTEFNLSVGADGRTEVALLDGEVELSNAQGATTLKSGEKGIVEPGKAPTKTALIDAINVIQWVLYYPAVVDPDELGLSDQEKETFKASLKAYREGDLLGAVNRWPESATAGSDASRTLRAAVSLAAGRVEKAEEDLKALTAETAGAKALREMMAAVKHQTLASLSAPTTGSEWMARSYYLQSRGELMEALKAAREAATKSPQFGAASVRVAELEFGFGHTTAALTALNRGLELSPRNAEGLALKGFVLAAKNKNAEALEAFDQAIAADGALANAWLGRGLVKRRIAGRYFGTLREARDQESRQDLQVAATLEPQRSVLRSYLGKAFTDDHDLAHARKELEMAEKLDPNDPTSWLYLALLNQQDNRINESVDDLEKSKELNKNRSLFRSQLLLDQDQAVRGANLAAIYRDEGMFDRSVQEAARAVNNDYGNYSAHLFLANSFDALRDPKLINLRYETPWFSELLVANLLSPVNGGNLSQNVSQQEYSKLFASDGLGVFSHSEYSSRGDWLESASQYGVFGNSGYSLDAFYRSENGFRVNNDLDQLALAARFKQQLTDKDSLFLQVGYYNAESGDVAQYYNQASASATFRGKEKQEPSLLVGYHHEWSPGSHTLFLGSRFDDTLTLTDPHPSLLYLRTFVLTGQRVLKVTSFASDYRNELEAYSGEVQQIWQNNYFTTVAGARFQAASAETTDKLDGADIFGNPVPIHTSTETDLSRISAYLYQHWQPVESLRLIGGVSYDRLRYPVNIGISPITGEQETEDRVSPKAGFLWTPLPETHVRGFYTRSLGGVFFDSSVRLEPVEVAGFNQAFRSIAPESAIGPAVPGSRFETWGLGVDQSLKSGTYVLAQGEILESDGTRTRGILVNSDTNFPAPDTASSTRQSLKYKEQSVLVAVNQLIGNELSLGARYKLTYADLDGESLDISPSVPNASVLNPQQTATLHQVDLYGIYQCRCGFFGEFDAIWSRQSNSGYGNPGFPGDDFWQYNLYLGYRFLQRRAEARLGLLNIADRDYRLNPLTLYNELPRERMLTVSLKLNF